VLRALGLGDLLTAVPALRALRHGLPGHHITLATSESLAPLALLTGAVDEVWTARGLAPLRFPYDVDVAVNLHGSGPQSHRLLQALQPRELLAFAHPECPDGPRWDPGEHEVERWCRLLAHHGFRPDPDDLDLAVPRAGSPAPGAVLVHPGAAYPARRWPPERYAAVAAALRYAGHEVIVTGGPDETALARRVVSLAGLGPVCDRSGRTDLLELAALVAAARLVVCGDTGVGHLATACGTPSILLFGPTSPALWGPPPRRSQHVVVTGGEHDGDPHGMTPDPGLLAIESDQVVAAALHRITTRSKPCTLSAPLSPEAPASSAHTCARPSWPAASPSSASTTC
jgi:ADP-heptose:LPS heptosyltransferase